MTEKELRVATNPDLKDVEPGSDADATPTPDGSNTERQSSKDQAAAMKNGRKPGPDGSLVQVRPAGPDAQASKPKAWDEVDEAVDESFPASDATAKY